LNPKKRES
jgi:hypothetical protein